MEASRPIAMAFRSSSSARHAIPCRHARNGTRQRLEAASICSPHDAARPWPYEWTRSSTASRGPSADAHSHAVGHLMASIAIGRRHRPRRSGSSGGSVQEEDGGARLRRVGMQRRRQRRRFFLSKQLEDFEPQSAMDQIFHLGILLARGDSEKSEDDDSMLPKADNSTQACSRWHASHTLLAQQREVAACILQARARGLIQYKSYQTAISDVRARRALMTYAAIIIQSRYRDTSQGASISLHEQQAAS